MHCVPKMTPTVFCHYFPDRWEFCGQIFFTEVPSTYTHTRVVFVHVH